MKIIDDGGEMIQMDRATYFKMAFASPMASVAEAAVLLLGEALPFYEAGDHKQFDEYLHELVLLLEPYRAALAEMAAVQWDG